jgi:hypothetical protein
MAYYSSTAGSSISNPPRLLMSAGPQVNVPAGSTSYLFTSSYGSSVPGNLGGGQIWYYCSTNDSTSCMASNFFTDGYTLGMKPGDIVNGVSFTSAGSTVNVWFGGIVSVSTAGASLSTGSVMTSS